MERNNLSKEEKAMLLYNVIEPNISLEGAKELQGKIIDAVSMIGCIQEEINPDCIYWLLEIHKMFGKIDEIKTELMNNCHN